ncbi:MAG TPA: glycosyltransferase family 2 protein [Cyclobacteriaceae bacterium]|nr:glycosyltransferase family 2 protein [Cyclobacteriaceae bacterium]
MTSQRISFVIPVFNESANIRPLHQELSKVMKNAGHAFEIIFVDDGSTDDSVEIIRQLGSEDNRVFYIELSRNFGQQYALKAGIDTAKGDCVISMDCDLQHPADIVIQLIKKWEEGYEVVYTRRLPDKRLPWLKRTTSTAFYKILNWLSDTKLESGVADFRLLNRNVVDAISGLTESGLFLRGLVRWVGFRQARIDYVARDRFSGVSKYSLKKMFEFAQQGLLSLTTRPLVVILYWGMLLLFISTGLLVFLTVSYLVTKSVSMLFLIVAIILFFFSWQLIVIGIVSVYMSRLVVEARRRPVYLIRTTNYI